MRLAVVELALAFFDHTLVECYGKHGTFIHTIALGR